MAKLSFTNKDGSTSDMDVMDSDKGYWAGQGWKESAPASEKKVEPPVAPKKSPAAKVFSQKKEKIKASAPVKVASPAPSSSAVDAVSKAADAASLAPRSVGKGAGLFSSTKGYTKKPKIAGPAPVKKPVSGKSLFSSTKKDRSVSDTEMAVRDIIKRYKK